MTQEWCPKCKGMVKVEDSGDGLTFNCTLCNGTTKELNEDDPRRKIRASRPRPTVTVASDAPAVPTKSEIPTPYEFFARLANGNRATALQAQYAYALTKHIAAQHGKAWRPVMRNLRASCAIPSKGEILFGWESLDRSFGSGFTEYTSIWTACWDNREMRKGFEGIYRVVIHEAAHLLQTQLAYGSVHNASFVAAVRELRVLFPFEECMPESFGV